MPKIKLNLRNVLVIATCLAAVTVFLSCKDDNKNGSGNGNSSTTAKVIKPSQLVSLEDAKRITGENMVVSGELDGGTMNNDKDYGISYYLTTTYKKDYDLGFKTLSITLRYYDNTNLFNILYKGYTDVYDNEEEKIKIGADWTCMNDDLRLVIFYNKHFIDIWFNNMTPVSVDDTEAREAQNKQILIEVGKCAVSNLKKILGSGK